MPQPPGRDTKPAHSRKRRTWAAGDGSLATVEKDGFGLWIDDVVYAFADISIPCLPVLYLVLVTSGVEFFGTKSAAMVAWTAMMLGAGTLRGGWVSPLGTSVRGWVSLTLPLVALRLVYYNLVLGVAAYGGGAVGTTLALPLVSVVFALLVGGLGIGVFPRLAEAYCRRLPT